MNAFIFSGLVKTAIIFDNCIFIKNNGKIGTIIEALEGNTIKMNNCALLDYNDA